MLVTIGKKFVRSYLYARKLGTRNVIRVMKGGKQIWPGEHDRIRRIVFELPDRMTEDWAYWQHVEAGLDEGVDFREGETRREVVGYEEYIEGWLKWSGMMSSMGFVLVCVLQKIGGSRIWCRYGKPIYGDVYHPADGPYRGAVKVGDMVGVDVVMCKRSTGRLGSTAEWSHDGRTVEESFGLPGISGSSVEGYTIKGQKRVCAGGNANVYSVPDGARRAGVARWQEGHVRGSYLDYGSFGWLAGESGVRLVVWVAQFFFNARLIFPGFSRKIKLKVMDIVYND